MHCSQNIALLCFGLLCTISYCCMTFDAWLLKTWKLENYRCMTWRLLLYVLMTWKLAWLDSSCWLAGWPNAVTISPPTATTVINVNISALKCLYSSPPFLAGSAMSENTITKMAMADSPTGLKFNCKLSISQMRKKCRSCTFEKLNRLTKCYTDFWKLLTSSIKLRPVKIESISLVVFLESQNVRWSYFSLKIPIINFTENKFLRVYTRKTL